MGTRLWKGLSVLIGALVGCGEGDSGTFDCPEYGCSSFCTINGTVVDAVTGEPIEGIAVDSSYYGYANRSGADGSFSIDIGCCGELVTLEMADVDGEDNGGPYASTTVEVETEVTQQGACTTTLEQTAPLTVELELAEETTE